MTHRFSSVLRKSWLFGFMIAAALLVQAPVFAAANLTIAPIAWNIVGLDSNNVNVGPNNFPVGARVCNTGDAAATNVTSSFVWDSADPYINLRPGTLTSYTGANAVASLAPGTCHDFYYEVTVTRDPLAYDHTRRYHITATADTLGTVSTPTPRELYVEHLVSQSRNQILDVMLNGVSIPAGGTMALVVGQTYNITLVGATATNGYEQLESFINFPNTIFQVLSVSTTYSADTSAYVSSPNDKLYGDACKWENDPNSPYYRSCLDVGKVGGNVTVNYQVKILQVPSAPLINPEPLGSLIYDFSGSSFHYNSDFGISSRIADIIDPSTLGIMKSFNPTPTNVNGVSALTFTLTNPNSVPVSGVSFTDTFPTSPGAMVVASSSGATTNGCGTPVFAPVAGAASISFSNGTIAANGTCTVKVNVTAPVSGTYNNTSDHLLVGGIDTGKFATATLTVNTNPPPPPPVCGLPLAQWTFPSGFSLTSPAPSSSTVTASAAPGAGINSIESSQNNTAGGNASWGSNGGFDSTGALDTTFNDYFQFAVDTTGLTSVDLSFFARRPNNNGPTQVLVYYGTSASPSGTLQTTLGNPPGTLFPVNANTWESSGTITFSSGLNPSGLTYFRIYGANAKNNNPGSDLYLDDVTFTGCGAPNPLTISKAFVPSPVAVGGSSTLTFTITNPNPTVALSGVSFTDTLPSGLTVTSGTSSQCGGTLTRTAPSTLSFSGGTLAAGASCTVTATVMATTAGPHDNVSGFVSSTETGTNTGATGIATASLTAVLPPVLAKQFAPNPVLAGGVSTLTFTITNPNQNQTLNGVAFTDILPTSPGSMVVAAAPNPTATNCGSPTFAPTAGAGTITFSGGTIAGGGTCTVTVNVTAPVAGTYNNTSGPVSHIINSVVVNGNSASDSLTVTPATPAIALLKQVGPTASGPWSSFLAVAPGGNVFYRFTIENIGNVPLSPVSVTDPLVSTASCTWPSPLPVASPTQDPTATCIVGPIAAATGTNPNTATASGTFGGTTVNDTSTATYATTGLTIVKDATETSFTTAGDVLHYTFQVTNSGFAPLAGPVTVADDKATDESCPAVTTVGDLDDFLDPGESITCTATYTITASDIAAGSVTNHASATAGGVTSNTAMKTVPGPVVVAAPSISKAFSPNPIAVGGVSTLTFTITNPNAGTSLTGVAFTDTFPAGMAVAATPSASTSGCGSPTFAPAAGNTSVSFSGGTIAAAGTCTVSVSVTVTSSGAKANTTGSVTSTNGGTGNSGSDTLTVLSPPSISKAFSPNPIAVGGTSTLTFTITNPNAGTSLTGVAFTDTFPAGMAVAVTPSASTSGCGSPTFAPAAGNTSLSFSGGTIAAAGTCTVSVSVTVTSSGTKANTTGSVTSTNGGTGNTGSDTLTVLSPPSISKAFSPNPIAVGGVSTLTFTITNPNAGTALTGVAFTDSLPAGTAVAATPNASTSGCGSPAFAPAAGNTSLSFSGGTIAISGTCTVSVSITATTSGAKANTTGSVTSTNGGTGNTGSDTLTVLSPPSISKAFSPNPIAIGGVSTLTFTITNPNSGTALTGVTFTDSLPAGTEVAATPNASASGCGSPTFAPAAGNTSLSFSGGTIAISGTCTVSVSITATTSGAKANTTGAVTSTNGGTGNTGSDTLTVLSPPSISKAFSPSSIAVGGTSTLTLTITNLNAGTSLTGVAFTDSFPAGMEVAATPGASTSGCGSPTFAPAAGNTSLSFSGGTIAASGTCTVSVAVTATTSGTKVNTTGAVTSTNGGTGNNGSDTLNVSALSAPSISKAFSPNPIAIGGVSTLTFTITNANSGTALNGVAFTDPLPAGMAVAATPSASTSGCGSPTFTPAAGDTTLIFSGGTIAASGTCTVSVAITATTSGAKANTTGSVTSTNGGTGNAGSDTLTVLSPPSIAKAFSPNPIAIGGVSTLTFTITNANSGTALNGVAFTDPLPTGTAVAATPSASTSGCGSPTFTPAAGDTTLIFSGGTIAASGTCTVSVAITATTSGAKANTTGSVTSTNGGTGNTGSDTLTVLAPLSIGKVFSPNPIAIGGVSTLTFTITNGNTGTAQNGVAFIDPLPAGMAVAATPNVSTTGCGSPIFAPAAGDTTLTFSGGTVAPSSTCTVTVDVTVTTSGAKVNTTSTVTSTNGGSGNTGTDTLNVLSPPSIAKAFSPTSIGVGGVSTLTFTITNPNAGASLTGVAFTDSFPAGMEVAATPGTSTSGCGSPTFAPAAGDTSLSFSGGTIAASGTCTVSVAITATTSGTKVNTTGNVISTNGGTGNTGTDTLAVTATAPLVTATKASSFNLQVNDLDHSGTLTPGDTLLYTVQIQNAGTADALSVTFNDTPDANTTLVAGSVTTSQGTVTQGNLAGETAVAVNIGTLPPQTTVTVSFLVKINNPFPSGVTTISNQGVVKGSNIPDVSTDDPRTTPNGDPTLDVVTASVPPIPTLSDWGLASLILLLAIVAAAHLRRRRAEQV